MIMTTTTVLAANDAGNFNCLSSLQNPLCDFGLYNQCGNVVEITNTMH
jgi:hypothetical protein